MDWIYSLLKKIIYNLFTKSEGTFEPQFRASVGRHISITEQWVSKPHSYYNSEVSRDRIIRLFLLSSQLLVAVIFPLITCFIDLNLEECSLLKWRRKNSKSQLTDELSKSMTYSLKRKKKKKSFFFFFFFWEIEKEELIHKK